MELMNLMDSFYRMRWLCSIGTMRCQSSTTTTRTTSRSSSSSSSSGGVKNAARKRRNELFDGERERQRREIGRIEKIEVKYLSATEEVTMVMNKDLSTPHDCAKHISEGVASVAALALLDNNRLWDMTRPLPESCSLQLLSMRTPERHAVNAAFWRTCSFLLGAVIDTAFKDEHSVRLHSFTWPNIKAGSFVHDAAIDMPFDWRPTDAELRALSAAFVRLASRGLLLERLQVSQHLAMDMFQENRHKLAQIPDIANNNNNNNGGAGLVTLYRAGDHVDISKGPMIG